MTDSGRYDRFALDLAGKHFTSKQVLGGMAVSVSLLALYGLRKYCNGGQCDIRKDLTGKNVVITGGNTGIGKETAHRLLELNANVIIGSRDEKKNRQAVEQLSKIGRGKINFYRLDLVDRLSIEEFAENVKRQLDGSPLHYLLNNAGLFLPDYERTEQGVQKTIGVNHFGHFYLTYLLWDKLKQSVHPRIVNVSSHAHQTYYDKCNLDVNDIQHRNRDYASLAAYSRSKKANILFTKELQRRMDQANVQGISVSLHPGVVKTELRKHYLGKWWGKLLFAFMTPLYLLTFKNAVQGAQTNIYCLLQEDRKLVKGGYYADCKVTRTLSPQVEDRELARLLWEESEKVWDIKFNL